jgi:formate/nitrite transporter FocA (FNT family)
LCVKKRHRDLVVVNPPLKLAQPMVWILSRGRCGRFAHRVVTSGEIISAILMGQISTGAYMKWLLNATSGNIVGGVVIVSVLNYGQVRDI